MQEAHNTEGGHGWQFTRAGVVTRVRTVTGDGSLCRVLVEVCEPCLIDIEPSDEPALND